MQVPSVRIDDIYLGIRVLTISDEPHPFFVILPAKNSVERDCSI